MVFMIIFLTKNKYLWCKSWMPHGWQKTKIVYPIIFISIVTTSVESNPHETIEYKPRKYSQSVLLVGKQTEICLTMYVQKFPLWRKENLEWKKMSNSYTTNTCQLTTEKYTHCEFFQTVKFQKNIVNLWND